jgi:uncharacterized protein (UPF0261 family)
MKIGLVGSRAAFSIDELFIHSPHSIACTLEDNHQAAAVNVAKGSAVSIMHDAVDSGLQSGKVVDVLVGMMLLHVSSAV